MSPKVSVIIACYNGAQVIPRAIDSALAQQGVDVEVVVVDDGSRDNSREVVGAYADTHPVRLICHETNKGIPGTRNTAIGAATGDFIGFLDQDDLWYPDRLASALEVFDADPEGRIGMVFGIEETRDLDTGALQPGRNRPPPGFNALDRDACLQALVQSNFVPTAAALFRHACFDRLGLLDESLTSGIDDWDFFLRVARHYDLRFVETVQAVRHVHGGNFTKLYRMVPDMLKLLARLEAEEPAVARVAPKARAHFLYLLAREQSEAHDHRAARRTLLQALRAQPAHAKHWAALLLNLAGPLGDGLRTRLRG